MSYGRCGDRAVDGGNRRDRSIWVFWVVRVAVMCGILGGVVFGIGFVEQADNSIDVDSVRRCEIEV